MTTQHEALRLADVLDALMDEETLAGASIIDKAAAELRRLYAINQELLEALKEIEWSNREHWRTDRARAAIAKHGGQA